MGTSLILVAMALSGYGSWRWIWARESRAGRLSATAGPCEHAAGSAACGIAIWLAVNWVLAFAHLLFPAVILGAALAVLAFGVVAVLRTRRSHARQGELPQPFPVGDHIDRPAVVLLTIIPLALWLAYTVTRGFLMPVIPPDANVYHLPKAVLLLATHGYARFPYPDFRVTSYPFNYELLLADVLAIDGTDHGTASVSLLFFTLVLLAAATQAERAWGGRAGALVSVLFVAATPIDLLLSGEQKNDMLAASAAALTFTWLGRWVARGERLFGALVIVCLAIDLGTKASAAFVAVVSAPIFLFGLFRSRRSDPRFARSFVLYGSAVVLSFVLLGGVVLVANLRATGHPFGIAPALQADTGYGAWRNFLEFPYLLLTVPFSTSIIDVYVPWVHQRWWWMTYEMHTSHYGVAFTFIAVALVPLVVHDVRRGAPSPDRTSRLVTLGASLCAATAMVPMRLSPSQEGGFNCFPRYLFYVVPAVVAYVMPQACRRIARMKAHAAGWETAVVGAAAAFFTYTAVQVGIQDNYAPFSYAWWIFMSAGNVPVKAPPQGTDHVGFLFDRFVGPRDKVLFDAGYDAWTYPALGHDWKRPVTFVPDVGLAPIDIPDDVQWVAVDHSYTVIWGDPAFKTMADAKKHFFQGIPTAEDLRTILQMDHDPRFRPVYRSFVTNQALFQRRPPGERPEDDRPPMVVVRVTPKALLEDSSSDSATKP